MADVLLQELFDAGILYDMDVPGLYGYGSVFAEACNRINNVIGSLAREDGRALQAIQFPPGVSRAHLEKNQYFEGFPHLAGTVHAFCGDDAAHDELLDAINEGTDWAGCQKMTDIALAPAACYPVYPLLARKPAISAAGEEIDVSAHCFRHEQSCELGRMRMFQMREFVIAGTPEQTRAFRSRWRELCVKLCEMLCLEASIEPANDPFFGKVGRLLAGDQRQAELKHELLIQIERGSPAKACASLNDHRDHFGSLWALRTFDGEYAHTTCVAFGIERLALAMFGRHRLDPRAWPVSARAPCPQSPAE
jgi:seryl-tRNA synthetase